MSWTKTVRAPSCAAAPASEAGDVCAPESIALDGPALWPLSEVVRTQSRRTTRLTGKFTDLPKGPWEEPPEEAIILPLTTGADAAPRGVLVVGANPYRRRNDDSFENFTALVARQIAITLLSVETFEVERGPRQDRRYVWRWRSSIAAASNVTKICCWMNSITG